KTDTPPTSPPPTPSTASATPKPPHQPPTLARTSQPPYAVWSPSTLGVPSTQGSV
ncbi:hypothetical protein A2U01_0085507, partial [Trifolium medium]|nr:hypothetical protein [Trifolium medium]